MKQTNKNINIKRKKRYKKKLLTTVIPLSIQSAMARAIILEKSGHFWPRPDI
jgi:hypothetical protein